MSIVVDKIKQDWVIQAYDDTRGTPHIVIDNWYNEKELKSVWHELEFYNLQKKCHKGK